MKSIFRTLLVAGLGMVLALLIVSPIYAQGPDPQTPPTPALAQQIPDTVGPLTDSAAPTYGQTIGWLAFQGAPTITDGKVNIWVWNEKVNGQNKLHIRTTTDGQSHRFTGTVTTSATGNFYNLALYNGTPNDTAALVGYNQFAFKLVTTSGGDGVDADWSGRWLSLNLYIDGLRRPMRIRYGAAGKTAFALPLNVNAGREGLLTPGRTLQNS